MDYVALVPEPSLLHDPLRRPVGRQGEADYVRQAETLESQLQDRLDISVASPRFQYSATSA
jgi:hypothetical protein